MALDEQDIFYFKNNNERGTGDDYVTENNFKLRFLSIHS